jgi:hypothetical protein
MEVVHLVIIFEINLGKGIPVPSEVIDVGNVSVLFSFEHKYIQQK